MLSGDPTLADSLSASIRHTDALALAASVTGVEVDSLIAGYEALPVLDTELVVSLSQPPFDLEAVRAVAGAMIERVDHMDRFADFVFAESEGAVQLLAERSAAAESDSRLALVVVLLLAVATIVVALIVARNIARPLHHLRDRAELIGNGELSSEPLPIEGPSDVRQVTSSMNDMAVTLAGIDDHMHALATSDIESDRRLADLPGQVGASMRDSMERVAALTRRLRASEAQLTEEARIDNLTGLPNRFAVLEHLGLRTEHARDRGQALEGVGVMFLDVDGFKSVNDSHGHAVGDVVLREIGRRLAGAIRPADFVARLGGDEFLVIVGDSADHQALSSFGHRLISAIEQPYEVGDQLFAVSASVGVTIVTSDDDALAAIERADAAVYQAKRRGRRRVEMFDEELQASIEHQAELELALRRAIQQDELSIHLQPLADLRTGLPSGAEVLVRWDRPGLGVLPPAEFIPIAERSGLIVDLERWVLLAACRRLAAWRATGVGDGLRLAVNISGRHLIEGDVITALDEAIAVTGADASALTIELTESHLLDDVDRAIDVLSALRDRGVCIAIDDFGTGYSSMTYLQKLPVDVVKIDRSFVSRATSNEFDATVIESVVTIGRALSLRVVTEGIETAEQLDHVAGAGCVDGQGYLLARPMSVEDAEGILFGNRPITVKIGDADRAVSASGGHPGQ